MERPQTMPHPHLVVETSPAGYRSVRLSRPERRNALDLSLLRAVASELAAASDLRIAGPGVRLRWIGPPGVDLAVGAWILPDLVGRGPALDLVLTGRWVETAEALALGLVSSVCEDPDAVAAGIATDLAGRGPGSGTKAVMAAGGLLDRLRAERSANRSAWNRVLSAPPVS